MKCVICLELLYKPHSLDGCGHSFCLFCVDKINGKKCPLCRTKYDKTVRCFELSKLIQEQNLEDWENKEKFETRLNLFKEITFFKFPKMNTSDSEQSDVEIRIVNGYEIKPGANLSYANLYGANLRSADLSDADLHYANLYGANLCDADLNSADLNSANLCDADLSGADLSDAILRGAILICANLSGVNLSGVNLSSVNLSGVNLSGADLSGADLSGVNLSGVNLRNAKLGLINWMRVKTGIGVLN